MLTAILPVFFFYCGYLPLAAQDEGISAVAIGPELQFYPAGMIPGARVSHYFGRQRNHTVSLRAAMNLTLRHDWGKHNDERGWGGGFTPGYGYYFDVGKGQLMLGARSDLWFMKINWEQDARNGETEIIVLQPTAEAGYYFNLKTFRIAPTIAFGREINIRTKGEAVGEGWILLLGVVFEWNPSSGKK